MDPIGSLVPYNWFPSEKPHTNQHTTSYFLSLYPPEGIGSKDLSITNTKLLLSRMHGISDVGSIKGGCKCIQLRRSVLHTTRGRGSSFTNLKNPSLLVRITTLASTEQLFRWHDMFECVHTGWHMLYTALHTQTLRVYTKSIWGLRFFSQ